MMKMRLAIAALLGGLIAACSPNDAADKAQPDPTQETSVTDPSDPFNANLPWDSSRSDVQKTGTGMEYIVLSAGDADGVSPTRENSVVVDYEGHLAESNEQFDSSYDRGSPATFPAGRLIPGFTEALLLMKPGDDWLVFIPANIGYGAQGTPNGSIPPNSDLVFRVNLKDVISADQAAWEKYHPWPNQAEGVQTTESGLQYVVLASGDAEAASPRPQDRVVVHYEGRMADSGDVFDSSFQRGQPENFMAGQLIPAWVEALQLMKPGDRWMIYAPSSLAYGEDGAGGVIPPNADLQFEMQLLFVMPLGDD